MVYKVYIGEAPPLSLRDCGRTDVIFVTLCCVPIGNLPGGTSEAEIEREFARFGTLATVWVARKPAGFGE